MNYREDIKTKAIVDLWYHSNRIIKQIDQSLGSVHGIGFTEYVVMGQLMESPSKTMRRVDLAQALGRTASGVTRMLLPMEKIGLVEKAENPRDARVSMIAITESGQRVYKEASESFKNKADHALRHVDADHIAELSMILNSL